MMHPANIQRILLPTDFSDYSRAPIALACTLADRLGAELHVLYVFDQYTGSTHVPGLPLPRAENGIEETKQEVAVALTHFLDSDWQKGHKVVHATREGHPVIEIIRYTKEQQIDLIVMGTHGRSGLPHLLIGSVAEKVVRQSDCPVLTVRPCERQGDLR